MPARRKPEERQPTAQGDSPELHADVAAAAERSASDHLLQQPMIPQTSDDTLADPLDEIRRQAYDLFLARGAAHGDDVADWVEAERIVRFRRNPDGGHAPDLLPS